MNSVNSTTLAGISKENTMQATKKAASVKTHQSRQLTVEKGVIEKQVHAAFNTKQQVVKYTLKGDTRKKTLVSVEAIGDRDLVSARELWLFCVGKGKPINWIESYKALLKYISEDYRDVFEPIAVGVNSGTRYHIRVQNVVEFLFMFHNNMLTKRDKKQ